MRTSVVTLLLLSVACVTSPVALLRTPLTDLPDDLAALTFTAEGRLSTPYVMLELSQPGGLNGFVVLSGEGLPVWYFRTVGGAVGFTRRPNGNFVFLDSGQGLLEVTPAGDIVNRLAQEAPPGRNIHHDVIPTGNNTLLFIADDWRPWNGAQVNGVAIWEWNPETGATTRRWSSFDFLNPDEDRGPGSQPGDWLHANSLFFGPRGNLLLSSPFLNQVISISPDYKRIEWRLGGPRATLSVADPFSGQHMVQEIAPGRILMFDNGFERTNERYSRAVEYEIAGEQARKVWEWRPSRDNWARAVGADRRLSNGNTLVVFGVTKDLPVGSTGPLEAYEVTASGSVVWHIVVGGNIRTMYRATPLERF
ncbi:MAG: hypothetical protein EXS64_08840 [Candidatus Latescibacteria bacterium]|nr:hypothetical protein [Candidatus Latescibacterota bacterium]